MACVYFAVVGPATGRVVGPPRLITLRVPKRNGVSQLPAHICFSYRYTRQGPTGGTLYHILRPTLGIPPSLLFIMFIMCYYVFHQLEGPNPGHHVCPELGSLIDPSVHLSCSLIISVFRITTGA